MKLLPFKNLICHLWALLWVFSLVFSQVAVPIRRDFSIPPGPDGKTIYFYSLVMDFPVGAVSKPENLAWLAKTAYDTMMSLPGGPLKTDNPPPGKRPGVVSVLRVDNPVLAGVTVYFASSMKRDAGVDRFSFMEKFKTLFPSEAAPLAGAMHACQLGHPGGHGHDAKCGEPLALAAFFKDGNENFENRYPLMAAYSGEAGGRIIRPCTVDGTTYGCRELLDTMTVRWVEANSAMEEVTSARDLRSTPQVCLGK